MKKRNAKIAISLVIVAIMLSTAFVYVHQAVSSREVLILMYHDIREEPVEDNPWIITPETFSHQMEMLARRGYTVVSFDDLIAFVNGRGRLPQRSVVVTFDDGYLSNLIYAAPILEDFGICATISVIGASMGSDRYRDTDIESIPSFSFDEVRPWVERGIIHIAHHSYDMHMVEMHEPPETFRRGVMPMDGESEDEYRAAFIHDFETLRAMIEENLGTAVIVYVYPYGWFNETTEAILRERGIQVTLTTYHGANVIERGNPETLFLMRRVNMTDELVGDELIKFLDEIWDFER